MLEKDRLKAIVSHDIDSEFLEALAIAIGWAYHKLYEELSSNPDLTDDIREEEFSRRRGFSVSSALASVANLHRVPVSRRKLECNGQNKTIVSAGRVLLIQEPFDAVGEVPRLSDYKLSMADIHGIVRQYELDLGDRPYIVPDWSGCILGVVLHGTAGVRFSREHRALGGLYLAVPDATYSQWLLRLDLQDLAMFGGGKVDEVSGMSSNPNGEQQDMVIVTRKKKAAKGAA